MPKKDEGRAKSKLNKGSAGSKPASPEREGTGTKKALVNRKRKANAMSSGPEDQVGEICSMPLSCVSTPFYQLIE